MIAPDPDDDVAALGDLFETVHFDEPVDGIPDDPDEDD